MNFIFNTITELGYLNILPIALIIFAAYFLIKSLEMIFKIIAYIFVIFIIYYFFGDVIFSVVKSVL